MINIDEYLSKFSESISNALNATKLLELKNIFLKNEIAPLYKKIREVVDKKTYGQQLNELKDKIELIYSQAYKKFVNESDCVDTVSDLGFCQDYLTQGTRHILNLVLEEMLEFFVQFGFDIVSGNEVVNVDYNFTNLNIPSSHPARNLTDSFFLNENLLLRTHCTSTTAQQIYGNQNDDIRVLSFGNVYRNDDDDATHSHQFVQMDLVWIRENLSVANFKWLIDKFLKYLFGEKIKTRYRLSHFPFTEPSFEVDVSCFKCNQNGCNVCKKTGWIEILGAGMLNDNVFELSKTKVKTGWAAGVGVERIAMLKYAIGDIRYFYNNQFSFIKQSTKITRR